MSRRLDVVLMFHYGLVICYKQDGRCACNVTVGHVHVINVAVEKQLVLHIVSVCL